MEWIIVLILSVLAMLLAARREAPRRGQEDRGMPYKIVTHPNGVEEQVQVGRVTQKDEQEFYNRFGGPPISFPSADHRSAVRKGQKVQALPPQQQGE